MAWVQNVSLRMEVKDLNGQITDLNRELTYLKTLMKVCDITKIFNELSSRSVYNGIFTSTYRMIILQELIARYQITDIDGPTDRSVVIRIMNNIGNEAAGEGLLTIFGERIKMSGG